MAFEELREKWGGSEPPYTPVSEGVNQEFALWRWERNYEEKLQEDPNFATRIAGTGSVHFSGEDPHDPAVIWSENQKPEQSNYLF